jgi:DNA-binding IclR family transcriptional regulator
VAAGLDLRLTVTLNGETIAEPPFAAMYWTAAQQLAHLTANGRAILAHTGAAQLRALFPRRADFITRTGRGPRSLPALARELGAGRERGWHGEGELVSEGLRSVGVPAFDHTGRPVAALSTTWHRHRERRDPETLAAILKVGADRLSERMSGGASVIPLRSA